MADARVPLSTHIYQDLLAIDQKLKQGDASVSSKDIGICFAGIAVNMVEGVFVGMLQIISGSGGDTSVVTTITDAMNKYIPWACNVLSTKRLAPVVSYILGQMQNEGGVQYITWNLNAATKAAVTNTAYNPNTNSFDFGEALINVLEDAVQELLVKPKDLLDFNFVVNKTLNGVISVTTSQAYKQLRTRFKTLKPEGIPAVSEYFQGFLLFHKA